MIRSAVQGDGFYRKPLPSTCVDFSSAEGKQLFRESLEAGYLEGYFKLASNFTTQAEPAFCGLGSLAMVLNSLEIDPNRIWKGPWRWFSEDMLDCCVPLDKAKETGITLDQFVCLALCNGAEAKMFRSASLEEFRSAIRQATSCHDDNERIVVSYSRAGLEQTGTGHFSPLAAYHPSSDQVLILDVARFKYPPHWVPVAKLYDAMNTIDPDTGLQRGFVILKRKDSNESLSVFFRLLGGPDQWKERATKFVTSLQDVASTQTEFQGSGSIEKEETFVRLCSIALVKSGLLSGIGQYDHRCYMLPDEHQRLLEDLNRDIASTKFATHVATILSASAPSNMTNVIIIMMLGFLDTLIDCETHQIICELCGSLSARVTAAAMLHVPPMIESLSEPLKREVSILRKSLQSMLQPSCCAPRSKQTLSSCASASNATQSCDSCHS